MFPSCFCILMIFDKLYKKNERLKLILVWIRLEHHPIIKKLETGPSLQALVNGIRVKPRWSSKHQKPSPNPNQFTKPINSCFSFKNKAINIYQIPFIDIHRSYGAVSIGLPHPGEWELHLFFSSHYYFIICCFNSA